ncbi:MAG TPA: hypothetical protein VGB25_05825 [Candidatus Binatia bacterium]
MRVIPELVHVVKTSGARRPAAGAIGTVRVDVVHEEQKTLAAIYKTEDKSFQMVMDEPAVRGGTSRGPTPLGTFVAGAAG